MATKSTAAKREDAPESQPIKPRSKPIPVSRSAVYTMTAGSTG